MGRTGWAKGSDRIENFDSRSSVRINLRAPGRFFLVQLSSESLPAGVALLQVDLDLGQAFVGQGDPRRESLGLVEV